MVGTKTVIQNKTHKYAAAGRPLHCGFASIIGVLDFY